MRVGRFTPLLFVLVIDSMRTNTINQLMENLFTHLEQVVLRMDSRFCTEDGHLLKNNVVEAALALDPQLLHYLLADEKLKRQFFSEVDGLLVFDKVKFQRFVMNKLFLPDSYTAFKNKVGLTNEHGEFLSESREVVLSWPYKDCMLEGGQTKEDAKRDEIFWNETLAPDEINRLTEPKAFTGFLRYDSKGSHEVTEIQPDDNLIIKGNNLLALYSLRKRFRNSVKLIYIDPPYYFHKPKPSDTFSYNSNFHLSTWLVFMRDRLRAAKELLSENGVILCHIKEDAIHWLKVLMEEIFYADNFVETFIWKNTDNPDSLSNKSRSSVEYIICFEKNKNTAIAYKGKETENGDAPILHTGNNIHELTFPKGSIRFNIPDGVYAKGKPDRVELITDVYVKNGRNENDVILKGEFTWSQDTLNENLVNGCFFLVKSDKFSVRVQLPNAKVMAPEKYIEEQYLSKAIGVGSNEDASTHLKNMGIDFTNSKPESVVAFFVRAMTEERDIVLDFFVGSGTTAAVAHKMNRRYIAVDQMDYIETETIKRMNLVIQGEQGGISQAVGWNPNNVGLLDGDKYAHNSFLYMELAQANQKLVEEIEAATDTKSLQQIWKQMQENGFMSYKVKPSVIDEHVKDFEELSFDDQKRFLIECLDKNLLYVPFEEMDDATYQMSEHDKQLTRQFYAHR